MRARPSTGGNYGDRSGFFRVDDSSIFLVVVFAILAGGIIAYVRSEKTSKSILAAQLRDSVRW
jgi:hypothetical protein